MDLTGIIESAERQFRQILEEFFSSVFNENTLSSHGIDHHRRVWQYSKELLKVMPLNNNTQIGQLPSKLIIACYLHDIGMSVDPGARHGKVSRDFCVRFLVANRLPEDSYQDVLEAVENHDNKEYEGKSKMNDLLTILSVSDDLDAFGFTGIFRYSEIYLTRGIHPDNIGQMIRENAKKRYNNFVNSFGSYDEIMMKHSERYNILDNFFINYNKQLSSYRFGTSEPRGYCGVIEVFSFLKDKKLLLKDYFKEPDKYPGDHIVRRFFNDLEKELS
jgi:hypothetical protein